MSDCSNKKTRAIMIVTTASVAMVALSAFMYASLRTPSAIADTEQQNLGTGTTQQPTPPAVLFGDATSFRHAWLPARMLHSNTASPVEKRGYEKTDIAPARGTATNPNPNVQLWHPHCRECM